MKFSFGSRQHYHGLAPISTRFRESTIREVPTVMNMGVVFDRHLTWGPEVSALVKKCNGILFGLSHVHRHIPLTFCLQWTMLWFSRTSDTVSRSLEMDQKNISDCKKISTLRFEWSLAAVNLATYRAGETGLVVVNRPSAVPASFSRSPTQNSLNRGPLITVSVQI